MHLFLTDELSCSGLFFPEWNIWMEFLENTISTLRLDSIEGSHPIEVTTFLLLCGGMIPWLDFLCISYGVHLWSNNVLEIQYYCEF